MKPLSFSAWWASALLCLPLLLAACTDDTPGEVDVPCDGDCPAILCVDDQCVEEANNEPDAGDMPDAEPDGDDEPDAETGCAGDEECPEGQICDDALQTPQCREGCRQDGDCPEGARCDPQLLVCLEGCGGDEDCDEGQACRDGACVQLECQNDNDCLPTEFCDFNQGEDGGRCRLGCRPDGCDAGQYCDLEARVCFEGCRGSEDCPEGESCDLIDTEAGLRQRCVPPPCLDDQECADNEYCGIDRATNQLTCLEGCRTEPDNCDEGERCDADGRTCLPTGCLADEDCGDARVCDNGVCYSGCRSDDACQGDNACLPGDQCGCAGFEDCAGGEACFQGRCAPSCLEDNDCAPGLICHPGQQVCVPPCAQNADCEVPGQNLVCDQLQGLCIEAPCAGDEDCAPGEYCDSDAALCEVGCRVGDCPQGERCDVDVRVCVAGCRDDLDCAPGFYCDGQGDCVEGCRNDDECAPGLQCLDLDGRFQCAAPPCADDNECGGDQFCGPDPNSPRDVCLDGCRVEPDNCPEGQICDPMARQCVQELCQGDQDCGPDQFCDLDTGLCVGVDCVNDLDCPAQQFCDTDQFPPACVDGCRLGECPQGQACSPLNRVCVEVGCLDDGDCDNGEFCAVDPQTLETSCQAGCQVDPDSCPGDQICNVLLRVCQAFICPDDDACGPGRICTDQVCDAGCRDDADCPDNRSCDQQTNTCGCNDNNDCAPGLICDGGQCAQPCAGFIDCQFGDICDTNTGLCVEGCRDVEDCGGEFSGLECDPLLNQCVGRACSNDDQCEPFQFCDTGLLSPRCTEGCRVGLCPFGQTCNLDTRQCSEGCQNDEDCGEGAFCDRENDECVPGCRDDLECPAGLVCEDIIVDDFPTRQCVPAPCVADGECLPDEFCGFDDQLGRQACTLGCRTEPDNCFQGSVCNADTRICEFTNCANDLECGPNQICFNDGFVSTCRAGCRDDNECAPGEFCSDFSQRCTCLDSDQCGEGLLCQFGECDAPCRVAEDCPFVGQGCQQDTGLCLFTCQNDAECDVDFGERCDLDEGFCVAGFCAVDGDCAPFQYCDEGQCEPGCRAGDCGFEAHCDLQTRTCESGCVEQIDCGPGFSCQTDTGACIPGCGSDADCPENQFCEILDLEGQLQALCIPARCERDNDCLSFEYCGADPFLGLDLCQVGCRPQEDNCTPRTSCDPDTRVCVPLPCNVDGDCVAGEICQEGAFGNTCVVGCRNNNQCGNGQTCNNGLCSCAAASDCPEANQGCNVDGLCVIGCANDQECFFPFTCNQARRVCEE